MEGRWKANARGQRRHSFDGSIVGKPCISFPLVSLNDSKQTLNILEGFQCAFEMMFVGHINTHCRWSSPCEAVNTERIVVSVMTKKQRKQLTKKIGYFPSMESTEFEKAIAKRRQRIDEVANTVIEQSFDPEISPQIAFGTRSKNTDVDPIQFSQQSDANAWTLYYTDEGHPYYYNHETGESAWASHNEAQHILIDENSQNYNCKGSENDPGGLDQGSSSQGSNDDDDDDSDSDDSEDDIDSDERFRAFLQSPEGAAAMKVQNEPPS